MPSSVAPCVITLSHCAANRSRRAAAKHTVDESALRQGLRAVPEFDTSNVAVIELDAAR